MQPDYSGPPVALSIAGSDPSGGAGIQADLKAFTVLGVYGTTIITTLTAQNTLGVTGLHHLPADFIELQARTLADDIKVSAVKTGLLGPPETVKSVIEILKKFEFGPIVVDPVLQSTSGDPFLSSEGIDILKDHLLPLATLVTPNVYEASKLLKVPLALTLLDMEQQACALLKMGSRAVLLKGGHLDLEHQAIDVLAMNDGIFHFPAPRITTRNTHGTGCTLSAAITSEFAKGNKDLCLAVKNAKAMLWTALNSGKSFKIGRGRGPVDFLYAHTKS